MKKNIGDLTVGITTAIAFIFLCIQFINDKYNIQTTKEKQEQIHKREDKQSLNEEHINKLVDIIWCEDRTSINGAKDVLSTIINRSIKESVNGIVTIKEMITIATKSYQFSCYNNPKIIEKQKRNYTDMIMKDHIRKLVIDAINGNFVPTHIGTHYYAHKKIKKPKWAKNMIIVKVNNNHTFLV